MILVYCAVHSRALGMVTSLLHWKCWLMQGPCQSHPLCPLAVHLPRRLLPLAEMKTPAQYMSMFVACLLAGPRRWSVQ